jgi:phosphohistidine phosphatase SixA
VIALAFDHNEGDTVLYVGHQPDLSVIVQQLTGRTVNFGPGDLAVIDMPDRRRGSLRLHAPAESQRIRT